MDEAGPGKAIRSLAETLKEPSENAVNETILILRSTCRRYQSEVLKGMSAKEHM